MSHEIYADCIEACNACADECDHCASACLSEADVKAMAECIRLDIDCAEQRHADMEHCRACADECRRMASGGQTAVAGSGVAAH